MYGKEKQFYFPHRLPMNSDNGFKRSDWIGQQKVWASAPPALRKMAAQYFLIPQTVESLGWETRRALMLSLKSRMRSSDGSSSKIVFAPFEDFKKTIVHSLGVTVTCTKIVQFRGPGGEGAEGEEKCSGRMGVLIEWSSGVFPAVKQEYLKPCTACMLQITVSHWWRDLHW
ncbi:hypothetical protein DFH08DRAFT_826997 [Mycena albidolilacea]|uniref:Uncharacterized protein n=1 Tax=Mycena albidolilacea TaxID=1033008 RepID=A0AAD6YYW7_9AGAR|nr:hypothetical protein DFH08DRAFT_826997 [Mycena albidolilacea]